MYAIANTTATILRGTSVDDYGDIEDTPVPIKTGVIAFISSPTMSPLLPTFLGSRVYEPSAPEPSTTRLDVGVLPAGTDVRNSDQILDEKVGLLYQIYEVTQLGWAGGQPDLLLTLKRVTTTEQA